MSKCPCGKASPINEPWQKCKEMNPHTYSRKCAFCGFYWRVKG